MPVNVGFLQDCGRQTFCRAQQMAKHGGDLFQTNPVFKGLCLGVPALIAGSVIFGGGTSSSSPAPPPVIVAPGNTLASGGSYQFGSPQTGPDPGAIQRQHLFAALYDSLRAEPRAGFRCDRLLAAAQGLVAQDQIEPSIAAAIGEVNGCHATVLLSDNRFAALSQAATSYQAGQTRARATALAKAGQAISGFDGSRDVADANQERLDLARAATTALQESDTRLQAFFDAKDGAGDGATPELQNHLVSTALALTKFDWDGLSPAQRLSYERAMDLAAQFTESDRRISKAIEQAVATRSGVPADATGLVDAFGILTSRDLERVLPTQKEALNRGRDAARAAAFVELLTVSAGLGKVPSPVVDEAISRMRRVIGMVDPAGLSPDRREALTTADRAVARVRTSERHIIDMHTAVDAWQKLPSPVAGSQVIAAYAGLNDYDHGRFSGSDELSFKQLEDAFYVASGKSLGLSAATKAKLPLFVMARDKGSPGDILGAILVEDLSNAGYHVADNRAAAAMIIEVTASIDSQGVTRSPTADLAGVTVSASLRAVWVSDGSQFDREEARANGQAGAAPQAMQISFQRAAKLLAGRFDQFVLTGVKS